MQDAETVLNVIRERGERGLPLENIYRLLYNRNLYLRAYGRLYSNQGAMTKVTTAETVDGMSLAKIDRIIDALRYERFRWTPVRRVNIPKPNGKTRPLGIPTWTDKLLQEVIRMILEAYYEPQFSDRSHGFRPDRGCHSALSNVTTHWTGVRWFVEGDIKGCFDNINHEVMLSVLGEKLHDNRFLRLLKYLLKAGYMEDWKYGRTLSGTPQGGVVSPVLANVYLDRLDKFVETMLIPAYTRGTARTGDKMLTLVASALAGGDCIDDADALRTGGTVGVLGCVVKAPSTLGTFLRSFRWGHVRQLDRVSRQLLARAWAAGGRTRRLAPDHRPGLDHLRDLWTGQGGSAPPRLCRRPRLSPTAGHCRRHRRSADVPAARGPGQHRPWRRPLPA